MIICCAFTASCIAQYANISLNESYFLKYVETATFRIVPVKQRASLSPTRIPTYTALPSRAPSKSKSFEPSFEPSSSNARIKPIFAPVSFQPTFSPSTLSSFYPTSKMPFSRKPSLSSPSFKSTSTPSTSPFTSSAPTTYVTTLPSRKPSSWSPSIRITPLPSTKSTSCYPFIPGHQTIFPSTEAKIGANQPTCKPTSRLPSITPSTLLPYAPSKRPSFYPSQQPTTLPHLQDISYRGGPILVGPIRLYNIYYGDFSSAAETKTRQVVDYFAANFATSPLYSIIRTYYQNISGNVSFPSKSVTLKKSILYKRKQTSIPLTRKGNVVPIILDALNNSRIYTVDNNAIYALIFNGKVIAPGFLTAWCGYHGSYPMPNSKVSLKFFVVGDPSTTNDTSLTGNCAQFTNETANGSVGGDSIVNIYAHEIAETITDYRGNVWRFVQTSECPPNSCAGNEMADACNFVFNSNSISNVQIGSQPYLIQTLWQRGFGCVLAPQ